MSPSIRAVLAIEAPEACPVAAASREAGEAITNPSRAAVADEQGTVSEEFRLPREADIDPATADRVFETDAAAVYRFDRDRGVGCVCERIERSGSPVAALTARDGTLFVTFHASEMDDVREIVSALMDDYEDVRVHQLTKSETEDGEDLILVDRSALTRRQREVLETSFELGYFDHPREANAGEVADALGINRSTFREHLAAAQRKLLKAVVDG